MKLVSCMRKKITGIMIGNERYEIIEEFFNSLLQRYQKHLKESMK